MSENTKNLLKLIEENPDLPVVPMVDGEIAADDAGRWMAKWGSAYVDEYLIAERCEMVMFRSDDDVFYVLERCLSNREFESLPESENECRPFYDALPWQKAIIVDIDSL